MKKIILIVALFMFSSASFAQKMYLDIGNTRIKDSTGFTTFNRSVLMYQNLRVKGYIELDTLQKQKIFTSANTLAIENLKSGNIEFLTGGDYVYQMGDNDLAPGQIKIYENVGGSPYPLIIMDTNGIDLQQSNMKFMIQGVPITGGTTNLNGYWNKDTGFVSSQRLMVRRFTIYRTSDTDSASFEVDGNGDLIATPVGSNVTFGSASLTGTKNVYAGAYYIGSTNLFANTNTWTARNTFNVGDSAIITHSIKGLTGQTSLTIKSPGDGGQKLILSNTLNAEQIALQTNGGYSIALNTSGVTINDARINWSTSSYGFGTDPNTYFQRNSADNVGITTGGTERINVNNSTITANVPFIVDGSYLKIKVIAEATRDLLTPAAGMIIFNSDTNRFEGYDGATWVTLN